MLKDKKIIIFDFDGTIVDSAETIWNIFNEISSEKISKSEIQSLRNLPAQEVFRKFKISMWWLPFFVRKARKKINEKILGIPLFNGIEFVLREVGKKYVLGIVTSNSVENVRTYLKSRNLDVFDFVYSVSTFGKHKTLKKILKRYKINEDEALYIGDETRDIEAARKCEVEIVSVSWGFNSKNILKKYKPDYLIAKPEELLEVLHISTK